MSIKDCIEAYHSLSREIFDIGWRPKALRMSKVLLGIKNDSKARSLRLKDAICRIISHYLPPEERSLYSTPNGSGLAPEKVPLLDPGINSDGRCRV